MAGSRPTRLIDRNSALLITGASALWASDACFRPALAKQLSASQIVLVESLLISLCFLPLARRAMGCRSRPCTACRGAPFDVGFNGLAM